MILGYLNMFSMRLDTLHKVLYNFLINFIAKHRIVLQSQTRILKICKVVIFMQISYLQIVPGIWHTSTWLLVGRGSWRAPSAYEAAPTDKQSLHFHTFTLSYHVPDYFGFQGRNFAKTDEPISLTHSYGHLLWHRMVFAEGPKQPEGNEYEPKLLIIQLQNKSLNYQQPKLLDSVLYDTRARLSAPLLNLSG